ncbi:energy transducer TonB [Hymenobacter metallilatus]|uniref:TonB family protein n=1 Tax=Hymenobacter metallilatus TaxID=2493666 RepID=A0A3R9UJL8_9BACT|nr:energy transducer TonB [Hymenobacter metallilatus]RSK33133.1 TonB family protein [Hymenobacter metallilatus]
MLYSAALGVLLLSWILAPQGVSAQAENRKSFVFYSTQHQPLPSSKGASYAIETEFLDSINATERIYWAPQKLRETATFSNLRLRRRDGETVVYYNDGTIKRREQYRNGRRQGEGFAYHPNGKLRRHDVYDDQGRKSEECFDAAGSPINCDTLARRDVCPSEIATGRSAPVYFPSKALKLGIQGVVKVGFTVSRTGQLVDVQIVESPSPILSAAAVDAIRRAKWNIRLDNCDPVDVRYLIPFTFAIK